jgi:hypothetical protein
MPGVFRDRLQVEVLDDIGDEALLVLQFHGIKNAAVRVESNEPFVLRLESFQGFFRYGAHDAVSLLFKSSVFE